MSKNINTTVGKTFQVTIPDNPTTGYTCALSHMPDAVCLLSDTYIPDHPVMAGSGGNRIFTFGAMAQCESSLKFISVRPWELQNPAEHFEYKLIIK